MEEIINRLKIKALEHSMKFGTRYIESEALYANKALDSYSKLRLSPEFSQYYYELGLDLKQFRALNPVQEQDTAHSLHSCNCSGIHNHGDN